MALLLALSASAVAAQGAPPDVAAPAAPIDAPAVPADAPAVPAATEDTGAATAEPADSGDGETASVEATAGDQAVTAITPTPSVVAPVPGTEEASNEFSYHVEAGSPERFGVEKLSATVTQNALQPNYGFASVRVQLANGYARKVPVTLSFTSSDSSRTVTRRVELRPHERLSVLLPTPQTSGGDLFLSTPEGVTKHRVYFGRANHRAMLLVGTPAQLEQSLGSDSSDPSAKLSVFPISPEELPSELSTLVGYDGILLTGARLEDLPQAQARALEAYAATGGYLALMAPGPGTAARLPMLRRTGDGVQTYGFGEVRLCSERRGACAKAVGREVLEHQPPVRPAEGQRYLRQDGVYGASLARRFLLPQAVPPVGRFLVIIAVFALVIGPGSLLIARRYGPSMLLFSIPATAVLTCLLIVSYSLVVDGFGTHANTFALTLLDRKNARAVTVGAGGFYANLAPRASRFGSTSAVVLPWGDEKGGVSVDWTEGATFGGDLVPSRLYRELGLLSVDPSRARLVVKREGGRVRVQNGLGSTVRWAVVRSGDELLEVRDLSDGGESTATKGATQASLSRWEDEVREPSMRFGQLARVRLKMELENGEFLALLDGPGPLPLGGITAEHHDSRHLVRGEVE
ncbi:MAG TPA: hypothetical protein VK447_07095 [Myxococcaceae bacterium]|nr:hypothetical protein [Myxococcaceae bacterium]